jgi:uncharacterized protein
MKRVHFVAFLVSILMLVVPGFAQSGEAGGGKPGREQVLQFLDLMHAKDRMLQMLDGMKAVQKKGAEEGFKNAVPDATAAQLAKVDAVVDEAMRDLPVDEIFDAMIPIYQNHLTSADLDAVVAFYRSPAGQKLLKEQPAMMAESMQAGQDIMLKKLPGILDRLKTRVAQLAEQEKPK